MSESLVSCIVPVHNGARFLAAAIESILAQTHADREIIVVDDGSTDETPAIIDGFGDAVLVRRQAQSGPARARNLGIETARGALLAFLDADDLWAPEKLERQVARLRQPDRPGFCVCHVRNFWEQEMDHERKQLGDHPRTKPMVGYVTQALLARRSAFDTVGHFDAARGHGDATDWFLRARHAGVTGVVLDEVLVRRRLHRNNLSRREAPASRAEFLDLVKAAMHRQRRGDRAS